MKTHKIHSIILGILLIAGVPLMAQSPRLFQMAETPSGPGDLQLPPLDSLIKKAVANSGAYHYYLDAVSIKKQEMHITSKEWFDFISLEANIRYGVNDQVFFNEFSYEDTYSQTMSGVQLRYYASVTAKFPLSTLISRTNRTRIARLNYERAQKEAKKTEQEIETLIVELYYSIKLSFKATVIQYDQLESSKMQMMKAEKEFIDEDIPLSEYSQIGKNLFKSQLEYETARNSMLKFIAQMELLCGQKIIN